MFADRLDAYLKKHSITNYRISKDTSISDSLIGYWRKGKKNPTLSNLVKLCDYLDLPADYLIGRMSEAELERYLHYHKEVTKDSKK